MQQMDCILHISGLEGEKYLSSAQTPDLLQLFSNSVTLHFSPVSIIIVNIYLLLRNRQTDTRCDHFTCTRPHARARTHTHTEVFAPLFFTLQNVNYILAGTVANGRTDRQTDMQNGVLHHPRKLLPLL